VGVSILQSVVLDLGGIIDLEIAQSTESIIQ
jgi:hypothetical protein